MRNIERSVLTKSGAWSAKSGFGVKQISGGFGLIPAGVDQLLGAGWRWPTCSTHSGAEIQPTPEMDPQILG